MKAAAILDHSLVVVPIDLDRADLARLRGGEQEGSSRRIELERLVEQSGAGPVQVVLELDLQSFEVRQLLGRALTNKTRSAQSLDRALVARTRSWPLWRST